MVRVLRRALRYVMLYIITLLSMCGVLEIVARSWESRCGFEKLEFEILPDGDLFWKMTPRQKAVRCVKPLCRLAEQDFTVETNSDGYRDDEFSFGSSQRVLFSLGDSETYGYGVRATDTYSAALERLLRGGGVDVDVMNLAATGYDVKRNLVTARRMAARISPRLIVLLVDDNDDAPPFPLAHRLPGEYRYYRSMFFTCTKIVLNAVLGEKHDDWRQSIDDLQTFANSFSCPVVVLQLYGLPAEVTAVLRKWTENSGGRAVLVDCSEQLNVSGYHFDRYDGHINEKGHRLVADALYREIVARRFL